MDGEVKKAREKMKKEKQMYKRNVQKAKEEFHKKGKIHNIIIKELTMICKQFKRKEDGKIPNKKEELIRKYKE